MEAEIERRPIRIPKTTRPVAGVPDVSFDLPVVGKQTLPKGTTDGDLRSARPVHRQPIHGPRR